jgi:hypothetical protein
MTDTLKSICEQCAFLKNPRIDFVPAQFGRHRETILRDLRELVLAASVEAEKTVVILCGSLFEAVLYTFLQSQLGFIEQFRGEPFSLDLESSLQYFVNIFNKYFKRPIPNAVIPDFIVGYRDLVHINREMNFPSDICAVASRDMLRRLDSFLKEISEFSLSNP